MSSQVGDSSKYVLRVYKHRGQYKPFDESLDNLEGKPWSWNTERPDAQALITVLDGYFGRKSFTMTQGAHTVGIHTKDWENLVDRFYTPFEYLTGIGIIQNVEHLRGESKRPDIKYSGPSLPERTREQWRDR